MKFIHADDTPVSVLAPAMGKTKTGRLWIYLRDERPHAGRAPPAVLCCCTLDRKGERCREHLSTFRGRLHADGYAGFAELYESAEGRPANVIEVACWAHVRRRFFDVHKGSPGRGAGADRRAVRDRAHNRGPIGGVAACRAPEPGQAEAQ